VVIDTQTGLSWTQTPPTTEMSESDGFAYCAQLTTAGGGWRLPSVGELQSIIDETRDAPAMDPIAFPGTPISDFFWSQSGYENFEGFGWAVSFLYGITTIHSQSGDSQSGALGWIRCVKP